MLDGYLKRDEAREEGRPEIRSPTHMVLVTDLAPLVGEGVDLRHKIQDVVRVALKQAVNLLHS